MSNTDSLLDSSGTHLGNHWSATYFPQAGEGSVVRHSTKNSATSPRPRPPEQHSAGRRSQRRIRRYAVANNLRFSWTLTYRDPRVDWKVVVREVGQFVDRLMYSLRQTGTLGRVERLPYVYVPEVHPQGHGLHVQLLVDRPIQHALLWKAWRHGFVHVSPPRGRGLSTSRREICRSAAAYVSKSLLDDVDALRGAGIEISAGAHRYAVAVGFSPKPIRALIPDFVTAMDWLYSQAHGEAPLLSKGTEDIFGGRGPPVFWAMWP